MTDPGRVLVVEHEADAPLGWLGEWLEDAGLHLDVRRPYAGEQLPSSLSGYTGLVVLGGSMGAYDDDEHPWLTPTKTLLREALRDDVATFGVCLGHQLASVALGGEVARHPAGRQIGVIPLVWTRAAATDPVFAELPEARGVHWNDDVVVELPPGAVLLAGTPIGGPQALRLGRRAWSVQFHPEAGYDIAVRWLESDERDGSPRDPDVEAAMLVLKNADAELYQTWQPVAARFAHQVLER